jgi:hypothetical protein
MAGGGFISSGRELLYNRWCGGWGLGPNSVSPAARLKLETNIMKRMLKMVLVPVVFCLGVNVLALGKDKPGPVSGTWVCVAHGSEQGDIHYTFNLLQNEDKVTGNFAENSDSGQKADIKDGSFKDKNLKMEFDAYEGTVTVTGTMAKKDEMSGNWTHSGGGEGTWECSKSAPNAAGK